MIIPILLVSLSLLAMVVGRRWLRKTPFAALGPAQQTIVWLMVMILLLLALTGRLGALIPLIGAVIATLVAIISRILPALIPLIIKYLPLWQQHRRQSASGNNGPTRSQDSSTVRTRYLEMHLNHATGEISGTVLDGPLKGRVLNTLDFSQLTALYTLCDQQDQESATLLGAYLQRLHGDNWKPSGTAPPPARDAGNMTRDVALEILGLSPDARREDIIGAHRRLMQRLHPDRGGTDYLAAKINQAKDVLLP
jgi:hypothetical protein